jgi:hypothetical protein
MASIFRRIFGESGPEGTWVQVDPIVSARIIGYMGRTTDRALIRSTILRRYGTGIRLVKDEVTGIDYEVYSKTGFDVRMAAGHIETVTIGFGHKIAAAIATLFSEPGQNFDLVGPSGADVSKASELLDEMRGGEEHIEALVEADHESIWLGSSPVFTEFVDGALRYYVTDPGKIQVLYEEAIESNGKVRPTNLTDIEDATCVVIQTGNVDDQTYSYVAIFGRSSRYPNGRYVSFRSSGNGREIPDIGARNSWDWLQEGEIANPLSWYANAHPEMDLPEYPIVTIHSDLIREARLFPLSESLLQEALEADVAASHIRATSGDNAKGTMAFSKSDAGGLQPVPKNLRGDVTLEAGQKLESVNLPTDAPKTAWELLKEEMTSTGQGFTVPDFHLRSEDHTIEASSGVALKVRSKQLLKLRDRRAKKNAPQVHKQFVIDKALISVFADAEESTIALLESCDQTWDPGEQEIPEDSEKVINEIERCVDLGIYDTIEAIRVKYGLSSEAEAIEKYEQLAKRAVKYPPLIDDEVDDMGNTEGIEDERSK